MGSASLHIKILEAMDCRYMMCSDVATPSLQLWKKATSLHRPSLFELESSYSSLQTQPCMKHPRYRCTVQPSSLVTEQKVYTQWLYTIQKPHETNYSASSYTAARGQILLQRCRNEMGNVVCKSDIGHSRHLWPPDC